MHKLQFIVSCLSLHFYRIITDDTINQCKYRGRIYLLKKKRSLWFLYKHLFQEPSLHSSILGTWVAWDAWSWTALKLIDEPGEFFRSLSDKSEYERARPMATLLRGLYLRNWDPTSKQSSQRGRGPFKLLSSHSDLAHLGGGGTLAGSTCRVKGVKIGR